jgi:hypothetical protein
MVKKSDGSGVTVDIGNYLEAYEPYVEVTPTTTVTNTRTGTVTLTPTPIGKGTLTPT